MAELQPLWYKRPARHWVEALPLGNGRIGAMVWGGVWREVVSLNEDTFWAGYPKAPEKPGAQEAFEQAGELARAQQFKQAQQVLEERFLGPHSQSYLPFGELRIDLPGMGRASGYRRQLDLAAALHTVTYEQGGVRYHRECFVSHPDQVLVMRLTADRLGAISARLSMTSQVRHRVHARGRQLVMDLRAPSHADPHYLGTAHPIRYEDDPARMGMRARALLDVHRTGGTIAARRDSLVISGADRLELRLYLRTSYNCHDRLPELDGQDEQALCGQDSMANGGRRYASLRKRHVMDHAALFDRVSLRLDLPRKDLPTDQRLKQAAQAEDPALIEQAFQYGRYLLIAASRPGTEAANLQGIWNSKLLPPWSSNYTVNINTQMNYWHAERLALHELHQPLLQLIGKLRSTGARTAQAWYGAPGVVAHHNTDLWALTNPVGRGQPGGARFAYWPMGYAWLCTHLMPHHDYAPDSKLLRKQVRPALRDALAFLLHITSEDEQGHLSLCPATSPENAFLHEGQVCPVGRHAEMDAALLRQLMEDYVLCCGLLGLEEDALLMRVREALPRVAPLRVGPQGQVLEWEQAYEEPEPHHRHVSHLFAFYPGRLVHRHRDAHLLPALEKSLRLRGPEGTGWSLAWKLCLWAHLGRGEEAHQLLKMALRHVPPEVDDYADAFTYGGGCYPNLFGAHPPFQIDSNYGLSAGIGEMLLQTPGDVLELLPALPAAWPDGEVRGLRAPGGVTVDIRFAKGMLRLATIISTTEKALQLSWQGREIVRTVQAGMPLRLTAKDFR